MGFLETTAEDLLTLNYQSSSVQDQEIPNENASMVINFSLE